AVEAQQRLVPGLLVDLDFLQHRNAQLPKGGTDGGQPLVKGPPQLGVGLDGAGDVHGKGEEGFSVALQQRSLSFLPRLPAQQHVLQRDLSTDHSANSPLSEAELREQNILPRFCKSGPGSGAGSPGAPPKLGSLSSGPRPRRSGFAPEPAGPPDRGN